LKWRDGGAGTQTYSKEAVDAVQEALTQAQKTHVLSQNIFQVHSSGCYSDVSLVGQCWHYMVSATPGNLGNLLEFEYAPGNTRSLLEFS